MLRSSLFWASATVTLLRHRHKFVMQTARTDCGVASALTVLRMLGRRADPVHAVDHMDSERSGTSLDALRRYFGEQHGFDATALAVPPERLARIRGRVILHMQQMHYVVLLRRSRRGVLVFDPAVGAVFYPRADFVALYSGRLLAVRRKRAAERQALPALPQVSEVAGGRPGRRIEPLALFVIGLASRMLECAILLCLVAALFLVLNHASFPSILTVFGLICACGGILLAARQIRFGDEDKLAKRRQARLWRGMLRTTIRGRDLNGFRGRTERDVSGAIRRGMIMGIPQRAQIPGALGALCGLTLLLCVLNPVIALAHAVLMVLLMILMQFDGIQVCRRSVRPGIGRYSKLSQNIGLPGKSAAPDLMGEVAKWSVIGFAGFSVLLTDLPPVALMFWILTAMQVVPLDFRRINVLLPMPGSGAAVSPLVAAEVETRRQRLVADADLKIARDGGVLRIDGIAPLTASLQQPDLTVREQRLIMADVVRLALAKMPEAARPSFGAIRIFGPGQDATPADLEQLLIARDVSRGETLPVRADARQVMDRAAQNPVLRNLHSCAPGDLPVFWDYRNMMPIADLQSRLGDAGIAQAAHLTMKRLTLVRAA